MLMGYNDDIAMIVWPLMGAYKGRHRLIVADDIRLDRRSLVMPWHMLDGFTQHTSGGSQRFRARICGLRGEVQVADQIAQVEDRLTGHRLRSSGRAI